MIPISETQQPNDNQFQTTEGTDSSATVGHSEVPGKVAIVFSIVAGLAMALITLVGTFCFTYIGLNSVNGLQNGIGLILAFILAGITSVAAFGLTIFQFRDRVRDSEEIAETIKEPPE